MGNWPNVVLPTQLFTMRFDVLELSSLVLSNTTINFSEVVTPEQYAFKASNYQMDILPATWDFDGNGHADALTDGLILLGYTFGLREEALVKNATAPDATRSPAEIEQSIQNALVIADIDNNSELNALTDGLLLLRYLFGLTGDVLIDDVIASNANRKTAEEITQHLETYMPNE